MFRGNLYGLAIALLSFVIAVMLTVRQVKESGVRVEFTIQPVMPEGQLKDPDDGRKQEVTENRRR